MKNRNLLLILMALFFAAMSFSICNAEPTIVEKNLFSPDRKPPSDEQPAQQTQHSKPSQTGLPPRSVQLDGVFVHDNVKQALVRVNNQLLGNKKKRGSDQFPYMTVSEGESIGDYKVVKIDSRSISLQKDDQLYAIGLFMDGKVVPPATPLPAAPISPPPEQTPQNPSETATPEQLQQALQTVLQQASQAPSQPSAPQPGSGQTPAPQPGSQQTPIPGQPRHAPRPNVGVPQP
ncbi:MAG: hypothetical protein WCA08_17535 [Desulfoferrobacter sp.]